MYTGINHLDWTLNKASLQFFQRFSKKSFLKLYTVDIVWHQCHFLRLLILAISLIDSWNDYLSVVCITSPIVHVHSISIVPACSGHIFPPHSIGDMHFCHMSHEAFVTSPQNTKYTWSAPATQTVIWTISSAIAQLVWLCIVWTWEST